MMNTTKKEFYKNLAESEDLSHGVVSIMMECKNSVNYM